MLALLLKDPKRANLVGWMIVAEFVVIAYFLQTVLDFEGVLDIDVVNFGLASYKFDVLGHQPHPPGYLGYVLFLKLIHALAPGLGPIDVAKWGTRICGLACIPAVYWTVRQLLGESHKADIARPLWAASVALFHPLLWYYGGDGQSHAAEALLTLLLVGASVVVVRREGLLPRLALVVAFGLAGSIRPNIPFLMSPLLVWVFWRRPLSHWAAAMGVGVVSVALWCIPLIASVGSWDLYSRASRALIGPFFNYYSLFSDQLNGEGVGINFFVTGYSTFWAILPLVALCWVRAPWFYALAACIVGSVFFYALFYTAEMGYLIGVAAISSLVPATWPLRPSRVLRVRGGCVLLGSFLLVWFGPGDLPLWGTTYNMPVPSINRVALVSTAQKFHRDLICDAAEGERTLLLTNNPINTHNRWIVLACPNIIVANYLNNTLFEGLNSWVIYIQHTMWSVPPPVPLASGPPTTFVLPPVSRIIISPGSAKSWRTEILASTHCIPQPLAAPELGSQKSALMMPASCLPKLAFGRHTLIVPAAKPGKRPLKEAASIGHSGESVSPARDRSLLSK